MAKKIRLLIVEDEEPIRRGLVDVFLYHGYEVESAGDGHEGLKMALSGSYDLVLLDVMLPGLDGFSICNEVRTRDREQPIIMLTAKTSDQDIIEGLRLGADDYVAKPFSVAELVLRVEAVLRRSQKLKAAQSKLEICTALVVDSIRMTASCDGNEIELTRREIDLLQYLWCNKHRHVSRGELLSEVWGYRRSTQIDTRTVDIHIAKLRRKIERDATHPTRLVTVRGEGYQLKADEA